MTLQTLRIHIQNAFTVSAAAALKKQRNHSHVVPAGCRDTGHKLPTRAQFKCWVHTALQLASVKHAGIELTIRLVDVAESAELNETYRHKTGPTNILSFPMEEITDKAENCYLGDLAICVPKVFQEATQQQKTPIAHWAHLTVHGVLHLLGYDHEVEKEAEVMEALEIKVLHILGFENPY